MSDTVNVEEAANLMKVHPKTVKEMIGSGALPAGQIGRAYVLMRKDVLNFIENMIIKQTAARIGSTKTRSPHTSRQVTSA